MLRVLWGSLLLTLALVAPVRSEAEPAKLRVTIQVAATDPFLGAGVVQFKNEVERETANALTVEIFDQGKLYIDDQVIGAVRSGAIEMGVAGFNQISKILPAASIMEQPFVFNFEALVKAATSPDSELRQLIDEAVLQSTGARVLWWQTFGPQVIVTKEGDARVPAHIKDRKIRAFSDTMASFAQHCGGVPMIVSTSKILQGFKDGSLDMAMISASGVQTRDLWQAATGITRTDHAAVEFLVLINEKVWHSLSEDQRSVITKAARKAERETRERASQMEAAAYEFARSKGMKVSELTPKEIAEWRACSSDVFTDYLDRGGELTQRLMKAYARLRTEPCCSAGPAREAFRGQ
jgi:C4-dicarboxylate-binding protein DctP